MEVIQYYEDGTYRYTTLKMDKMLAPLDAREKLWQQLQSEEGELWEQLMGATWNYEYATPGMSLYGGYHIGSHR